MAKIKSKKGTYVLPECGLRVSSKLVVTDLRQVCEILEEWAADIETAISDDRQVDIPTYRAELSLCAAKLEALVHAEL